MKDDIQKTALRLPRELHTEIHEAAKASGRTMNAEIVHRLQQSFVDPSIDITDSLVDQILAHKGGKLLESQNIDVEDLSQLLNWISEVQSSLIQRLVSLKGIPQGDE